MYRLLIVDDEDQIVDWFYDLFKTEGGLELDVYKAYSGSEAIEWMQKLKIDILLTDMCMPGIDGMGLLNKVKEFWPECKVIFLTAHNEFDYIYEISKHKDASYLLKSEKDSVIVNAVKKVMSDIDAEHVNEAIGDRVKELEKMALPLMQKEFFSDLLDGLLDEMYVTQQRVDELEIRLNIENPILMVVGKIDSAAGINLALDWSKLYYGAGLIAERFLSIEMKYVLTTKDKLYVVWMIQKAELHYNAVQEEDSHAFWFMAVNVLKWSFESIQRSFKESLGMTMSFAISNNPCDFQTAAVFYASLKHLLNLRMGEGVEMIISEDIELTGNNSKSEYFDSEVEKVCNQQKKISLLASLMENGTKDEFMITLGTIVECLRKVKSMNYSPALEIYYSVSIQLLSQINRWNLKEKLSFKGGTYKLFLHNEFPSWNEAVDYIYYISKTIFEIQNEESLFRTDDAISRIKQYIKKNIEGELSLYKLSEVVHFNPVYLSQLFKQATGNNLSDYINNERIKKAKELLLKHDLKVYEVATAVGCSSANYFVKFFKKQTGVTPQEFRNQNQSNECEL